ncbi:hypothetical protein ABK040_000594 [Willaertia magna]
MALAFLNLKSFHPANKANQRKKWIAEQQHKEKQKKEEAKLREFEQEKELYKNEQANNENKRKRQNVDQQSELKKRKQQLKKNINPQTTTTNNNATSSSSSNYNLTSTASSSDNIEFVHAGSTHDNDETIGNNEMKKKKSRRGRKKKDNNSNLHYELSSVNNGKNPKSLNFMYQAPPGLKELMEKEKKEKEEASLFDDNQSSPQRETSPLSNKQEDDDNKEENKDFFPKPLVLKTNSSEINEDKKHIPKDQLTDAEKFPFLKLAPTEGKYTENVKVKHKPFGIELRNVKCTKCGQFGHTNIDRECPMFGISRVDAERQAKEDPLAGLHELEKESKPTNEMVKEGEVFDNYFSKGEEEESEDPEEIYRILSFMSTEDKKKLYKKYKKLKNTEGEEEEEEDDLNDDYDENFEESFGDFAATPIKHSSYEIPNVNITDETMIPSTHSQHTCNHIIDSTYTLRRRFSSPFQLDTLASSTTNKQTITPFRSPQKRKGSGGNRFGKCINNNNSHACMKTPSSIAASPTSYQPYHISNNGHPPYEDDDSKMISSKIKTAHKRKSLSLQNIGQYTFDAVRITRSDFLKGWEKTINRSLRVCVDIYKKTITITLEDDTKTMDMFVDATNSPRMLKSPTPNATPGIYTINNRKNKVTAMQPKDILKNKASNEIVNSLNSNNRIVMHFDDITGLEFQHSPLSDDIVVIELNNEPEVCPTTMKSNFYFLYISKEDSAKFMDGALLSSDKRLLKLAIKGLPTWATIVNRYSLPVYYSYRFRELVTTLVNIYIVISLIWGFYDLYKNLPIVGGTLRAIFGPVVSFMEPFLRNRVMLFIPLLLTKAWEAATQFFNVFAIFKPFGKLFSNLWTFSTSVLYPLGEFLYYVGYYIIYPFFQLYNYVIYPIFRVLYILIVGISDLVTLFGTGLYKILQLPISFVVEFVRTIYDITVILIEQASVLLSYPYELIKFLFQFIYQILILFYTVFIYPFVKLKSLFTFSKELQKATEAATKVVEVGANTAAQTNNIKEKLNNLKENFQPFSSLWTGIRRIIDSIIYSYHTKIKHRSVWKRRLLITLICVFVTIGVIVIIAVAF